MDTYWSGFRENHSKDTCLSLLTDWIVNGAENGKHTDFILIDHKKAFDSIDHKILSDKMNRVGLSDKTIKWFHPYFTNRNFSFQ